MEEPQQPYYKRLFLKYSEALRNRFFPNGKPSPVSLSALLLLFVAFLLKRSVYNKLIPASDVASLIARKQVRKAIFGSVFLLLYKKEGYSLANRGMLKTEEILEALKKSNTKYSSLIVNESQVGWTIALVIYCYFCYRLVMGMTNQNAYKGRQRKDLQQQERNFTHVGGCTRAKEALLEVIDFIRKPDFYQQMGTRMPRGVLLFGPPGTGKTLIAKAAASEAGIPVLFASGSEFVEVFAGLGAKRVRDLFKQARALQPCMIFIDEIDAVGFHRGQNVMGGHRESETTLNQLLNEMDGFEENESIIVVAATNLASSLDPALLRPGRFDHKIEVTLPSLEERREILKIHLKNKPNTCSEEELIRVAQIMENASGADLENLVNLATLCAVRKSKVKAVLTGEDLINFAMGQKQTVQQQQRNPFIDAAAQMFGKRVNK